MIELLVRFYLTLSPWWIAAAGIGALISLMALLSCEVYGYRYRRYPLAALPSLITVIWVTIVYVWFGIEAVDINVRASVVRLSLFMLLLTFISLCRGPLERMVGVYRERVRRWLGRHGVITS